MSVPVGVLGSVVTSTYSSTPLPASGVPLAAAIRTLLGPGFTVGVAQAESRPLRPGMADVTYAYGQLKRYSSPRMLSELMLRSRLSGMCAVAPELAVTVPTDSAKS